MPNDYSNRWIETYLLTQDPAQTAREVAFLHRQLPLPRYRRILDICCGAGRHSAALARLGYDVTGIDRDPNLIAIAQRECPTGRFHVMDVRDLERFGDERFDGLLCLWQSFGHFDSATNDAFLRDVTKLLTPGGRFILDIYHRGFFESHQGTRPLDRSGQRVTETKRVTDGRLRVELSYEGGESDVFEWELFFPQSLVGRASPGGLRLQDAVTGFDEQTPASAQTPRMQLVFVKDECGRPATSS